jgi:1-acyl-sn-glycerol-3-phosphate acyltransferase
VRAVPTPPTRPSQTLEDRIAEVVARVTGRRAAEPEEDLALDSLGAAELVLALEEEFDHRLKDDEVPRSIAHALRSLRGAKRRGGRALRPGIGHLQWLSEAVGGKGLSRFFRLRVEGVDGVPADGAVVLASNHDSLLDIPVLAIASPRKVWFMAKRELFRPGFPTWFFHALGGFPVDRVGPDVEAVRSALEVLDAGRALGMYPEGTRSRDFLPFLPGAAWLALAAGAPLVPVGITGTADAMPSGSRIPRRTPVRVRFGEPRSPGKEDDPRARLERARGVTEELRADVERLLDRP